jgi:anti-sigma factor RsiW
MPQTSPCPDPRDLLRFTLGQVPEPEAGPLGQHLLSCPQCADTLNNLRAEDTLIDALRGGRDTFPPDLPAGPSRRTFPPSRPSWTAWR